MAAVLEGAGAEVGQVGADPGVLIPPAVGTMGAAALFTVLSDALNFVSPPSAQLPMIESVRIEATGDHLVAVATDRFVLGVSRADYSGPQFTLTLRTEDAKTLARMAKRAKAAQGWRQATIVLTADGAGAEFRFTGGEALAVRSREEDFPRWRLVIPADDAGMGSAVTAAGVGYPPVLMAKFARVRPDETRRRMVLLPVIGADGRLRRTVVTIGEDFIGAIMPVLPPGDVETYACPSWLRT